MEKENSQKISMAVINRLPRYYRYLGDLLSGGVTRISSKDLSKKMNVTASQIRQDLNNFGCFGQQGYGYNVEILYSEIQKILGICREYNMVLIGAGNIGQALLNYANFSKRGFNFIGVFDINTKLVGINIRGLEILDIENLDDFLSKNEVDIAVLTLSKNNVQSVIEILSNHNIKGIWNFSNLDIKVLDDVVVEDVHLTDSLMTLSYKLNNDFNTWKIYE